MKKTALILCAALLALVSCNKQLEAPEEGVNASPAQITFKLDATHPDGGATKAVKTAWETGDVIFVFFSGQAAPSYLELKWDGTTWDSTPKNSLALAESESGTMTAVFLPFGKDLTVGDDGSGNYIFSEPQISYYLTGTLSYTVTGGEVSGTFDMQIPTGYVQFFLDDASADPATEIELREPNLTPQGIAFIAADGTITHLTFAHGAPLPGYVYDKEVKASGESKGWLFSGILASGARNFTTDYHFTLVSGGWQGDYYGKAFTSQLFYENPTKGRALKLPALSTWTAITDYKPIDLGCDVTVDGVTKRIYWCSRNLGAGKDLPEADTDDARHATWGDYYAWGEKSPYYKAGYAYETPGTQWITGKTGYNWASYPMYDGYRFSKYTADKNAYAIGNTADGLSQLELIDDAARANLPGTLWRMPTVEEWETLIGDKSNWAWDATKLGRTVTVKGGTAWSDPTIFLPAAGYWFDNEIINNGSSCSYWSSSLNTEDPRDGFREIITNSSFNRSRGQRFTGQPVRPVTE